MENRLAIKLVKREQSLVFRFNYNPSLLSAVSGKAFWWIDYFCIPMRFRTHAELLLSGL